MNIEAIRTELIEIECAISLDHAKIHFDSALEAAEVGDDEQVAHDASIAANILLCLVRDIDNGS